MGINLPAWGCPHGMTVAAKSALGNHQNPNTGPSHDLCQHVPLLVTSEGQRAQGRRTLLLQASEHVCFFLNGGMEYGVEG